MEHVQDILEIDKNNFSISFHPTQDRALLFTATAVYCFF